MTDYPFNPDKPVKADTITNFCVYTEQNAEHLMRSLYGFVRRPKFRWKDADEIYIGPGCYHHYGSTRNRLVWWNSELTYAFGSAGSNAHSDDLGNNQWHYLFIYDDHVNVLASNELTATCFSNDTTAPTWSDTYHGWYTGNNRCIGAFLTGATANILEFFNDGSDLFFHAGYLLEANAVQPSNAWTDVNMASSVPGFSTKALCTFTGGGADALILYWRTNGQADAVGHWLGTLAAASVQLNTQATVYTDSGQIIEIQWGGGTTNSVYVLTDGWYLPVGM